MARGYSTIFRNPSGVNEASSRRRSNLSRFDSFFGGGFSADGGSFGSFFEDPQTNQGTPVFDMKLSPFLNAMPGLEDRAQRGDANAAQQLSTFSGIVESSRSLYDRFYATGLNDRNAAYGMEHVMKTVRPDMFGTGTTQFQNAYADYLSTEAIRRGTNIEKLIRRDSDLDFAFKEGFSGSLDTASDSFRPAGSLKNLLGQNQGVVSNYALAMKKAYSDWEQDNGLRDDETSKEIMTKAATLYAKCCANEGLKSMKGNLRAIIEDAAGSVGANGAYGQSRFDSYDLAVKSIPDRITFSGSKMQDLAEGLIPEGGGSPLVVKGIQAAYTTAFGRNMAEGRSATQFSEATRNALKEDLIRNLANSSPQAAGMADGMDMLGDYATALMGQMDKHGTIDLSSLAQHLYHDQTPGDASGSFIAPEDEPEAVKTVKAAASGMDIIAEKVMTQFLAARSPFKADESIRANRWNKSDASAIAALPGMVYDTVKEMFGYRTENRPNQKYSTPEYVPEAIRSDVTALVENQFNSDESLKAFAAVNPKAKERFAQMLSDFVIDANLKADPVLISGNIENGSETGYRTGAQDLSRAALSVAMAEAMGFDVSGWKKGDYVRDTSLRGRGKDNFAYLYGNLSEIIDQQVKQMKDADGNPVGPDFDRLKDPVAYMKGRYGSEIVKNLGQLSSQVMSSQSNLESLRKENEAAFKAQIGRLADNLHEESYKAAGSSASARMAREMVRTIAPRAGTETRQAALQELTDSMFSSLTNPRLVSLARNYVSKTLALRAPNLGKDGIAAYTNEYLPGVIRAYKLASRNNPQVAPADWYDPTVFQKNLDVLTKTMFKNAEDRSKALHEIALQERLELERLKNQAYAERQENS